MNTKANLQVPISVIVKKKAEKKAADQGFSSLQELVRVFITNYTTGNVSLTFANSLSEKTMGQLKDDFAMAKSDIKTGKTPVHSSAADAIQFLNSL